MKVLLSLLMVLGILIVTGCDKDNSTSPQNQKATFIVTVENVAAEKLYPDAGIFNTPVGAAMPAPIGPGEMYEVSFHAVPGNKLSFAAMMVQSNDFFYAPDENGIELFNGTTPITGDITGEIMLWDAGTEINQEPGLGVDQAPRQSAANTGAADPTSIVRLAPDEFANLPAVDEVLRVSLISVSSNEFTLRIENVSEMTTLKTSDNNTTAVPVAPGVFVIHDGVNPLFTPNMADKGEGLEALAEDGDPSILFDFINMDTGITHILAPGVYAVGTAMNVLFEEGMPDFGEGLEALAEDGNPAALLTAVSAKSNIKSAAVFNTPVGATTAGPALPGQKYEFTFEAEEGDRLHFATMMVQSNDLFFSPDDGGIPLFETGAPVTGDISARVMLFDAGTEKNELPGFGLNQAPRQSGANTGMQESKAVGPVNDGFSYPPVTSLIKVTIQAQ